MGKQLKKYFVAGLQLKGINSYSPLGTVFHTVCWVREWAGSVCVLQAVSRPRERQAEREMGAVSTGLASRNTTRVTQRFQEINEEEMNNIQHFIKFRSDKRIWGIGKRKKNKPVTKEKNEFCVKRECFKNGVVMQQIILSFHNKPLKPHPEAPESKKIRPGLSTALTHGYWNMQGPWVFHFNMEFVDVFFFKKKNSV